MEIKDIRRIVELMKNNDLTEFSMKDEDCELAMKRGNDQQVVVTAAPVAVAPVAAPEPSPAAPAAESSEAK